MNCRGIDVRELHKPLSREEFKTAAGKNRMVPIAEKIFPLVEELYNPRNEYLLTLDGEPLLNGGIFERAEFAVANLGQVADVEQSPAARRPNLRGTERYAIGVTARRFVRLQLT